MIPGLIWWWVKGSSVASAAGVVVKGLSVASASVQVSVATQIQSLAQELPHTSGVARKKKRKKKKSSKHSIKYFLKSSTGPVLIYLRTVYNNSNNNS